MIHRPSHTVGGPTSPQPVAAALTLSSLAVLALMVPSTALAEPYVNIQLNDGQFVDAQSATVTVVGGGMEAGFIATLNGTVIPLVATIDTDGDGVADRGEVTVDLTTVDAGLGQVASAMHVVRAELLEPPLPFQDPKLVAADHVAFYDTSELGGAPVAADSLYSGATALRVTDNGLQDVATVATAALVDVHANVLTPELQALIGDYPQVDSQPPSPRCTSLDALGLTIVVLGILPVDFGLTDAEFAQLALSDIDLCLSSGAQGGLVVDIDDILTDRPDLDLDGVMDPLVHLDSQVGGIATTITLGPADAHADIFVGSTVELDAAALQALGLTPTNPILPLGISCSADLGLDWLRTQALLDLDGTGTSDVAVASLDLDFDVDLESEFGGMCVAATLYADLLERPVEDMLEDLLPSLLEAPLTEAIEEALKDVVLDESIAIGDATLDVEGFIADITEANEGITVTLDGRFLPGTAAPTQNLVVPQQWAYATWTTGPSFVDAHLFDATVFAEVAWMDQALHHAYNAGAFHRELSTAGDLQDLGLPSSADPSDPIRASAIEGLDRVGVPGTKEVIIELGPKLAPIVVVEDTTSPPYTMTTSMFGVEINILDANTGELYLTAVSDLKADVLLGVTTNGNPTAQLANVAFQADTVGSGDQATAWSGTGGNALRTMLRAWVQAQLNGAMAELPLPNIVVPVAGQPVVEVDGVQATTIHSGAELYIDVEPL